MTTARLGVLLPTREMAIGGDYRFGPLLDFARAAEDLGFDSLWAGDSLTARARLDPLVVLSGVAAVTRRIGLGTAALTAALRGPVQGANAIAALDHAAGGRLTVGLGSGFPIPESEQEFAAAGVPTAGRAGRLDEIADLWRHAWRTPGEPFKGRRYEVDCLDRLPPPHAKGGPPLWLAASDTPRVIRRVAAHYDGWLPFVPTPEAYGTAWNEIGRLTAAAGREPTAVTPGLYATVVVDPDAARAEATLSAYVEAYYGYPLELVRAIQAYGHGGPDQCAAWLAGYLRAGARHIVLRIGTLDDPIAQLQKIAETLLPAVHGWPDLPMEGNR
ncbi:LLM class flavin-dependent oxidoreductase [Streptosporangiaceae bacterium NEAU-GS5]|nr:LLM class flavin-dependent oxidoreductase [Streptosporangiaceae bacterium NEAU-GS5]